MDIGSLRHVVTLQTPTTVPDGDGGFTTTWATLLANVPAEIKPAGERDLERTIASTVQSTATHIVTIRYLAGVTTQTRVLFGAREFSVTGVANPQERDISLVLVCQERVL